MLMEVQFAADAAGYVHNHIHEQISYCIAGKFEYSLDGRVQVLSAGESIYVFGPGQGAPGVWGLSRHVTKSAAAPVVMDSSAVGRPRALRVRQLTRNQFRDRRVTVPRARGR